MDLARRHYLVYALLAAVWLLVIAWQAEEHWRVRQVAKTDLTNRSHDIANTISACIRGMRFFGTVRQERLEPLLRELVNSRSNELVKSSELVSVALLNADGEPVAAAGRPIDFEQHEILQKGERWGQRTVTFVSPVDLGAAVAPEDGTNPIVVLPPMTNNFRENRPPPPPRGEHPPGEPGEPDFRPPPDREAGSTNQVLATNAAPRPDRDGRRDDFRPRRMRWMNDPEFQALMQKRALHGLVLTISTEGFQAALNRDLWLRGMIVFLASIASVGCGLAWQNLVKSSDLQFRLIRASEMNTHLKEMNVAAAGLAHETRNPLNIIRGLAQLISKQPETAPEVRNKAADIINEADKVAAQLNEFINYSKPREVRRSALPLGNVINEVVRALGYDLEEKQVKLDVRGDQVRIEADEQLLRQALFNLLLNAVQAVEQGGAIEVVASRQNGAGALLEIRDNGPGVPPERRDEIFKPYFTTNKTGTGLGLAVVQQIVLAHGWDIQCLPNQPKGAIFRISHLKLA